MRLFEVLHTLPEILRQGDYIDLVVKSNKLLSDETTELVNLLTTQCEYFRMRLSAWYEALESNYPSSHDHSQSTSKLHWFESSTLYDQLPPGSPFRIFPSYVCFKDPDVAYQTVLHWTALLLMYSTLHFVHARLQFHKVDPLPYNFIRFTTPGAARSLALLIAQSLEYFVHPDMGLLGTNIIGFPLSVTQGYFSYTNSEELLWFDVIFQRIRDMGSGLRGFLKDMAERRTVELVRPWDAKMDSQQRNGLDEAQWRAVEILVLESDSERKKCLRGNTATDQSNRGPSWQMPHCQWHCQIRQPPIHLSPETCFPFSFPSPLVISISPPPGG